MLKSLIAALDLTGRKEAMDELHKNKVRLKGRADRPFRLVGAAVQYQSRDAIRRTLPDFRGPAR
jgi:hypothetical protein